MLDELMRDTFARQFDTRFRDERQDRGTVILELVKASEVRLMPGSDSFSIVLRGPLGAFLPQAIHRFDHDELGAFELFIIPIRRDDPGFYYEAVFNRMCQEGQA